MAFHERWVHLSIFHSLLNTWLPIAFILQTEFAPLSWWIGNYWLWPLTIQVSGNSLRLDIEKFYGIYFRHSLRSMTLLPFSSSSFKLLSAYSVITIFPAISLLAIQKEYRTSNLEFSLSICLKFCAFMTRWRLAAPNLKGSFICFHSNLSYFSFSTFDFGILLWLFRNMIIELLSNKVSVQG